MNGWATASRLAMVPVRQRAERVQSRLFPVPTSDIHAVSVHVVEECLVGHEASILAIVDGSTIVPLDASQDHKRALDNCR